MRRKTTRGEYRLARPPPPLLLLLLLIQLVALGSLALAGQQFVDKPNQASIKITTTTTTLASASTSNPAAASERQQQQQVSPATSDTKASKKKKPSECRYEKSPWTECQPNGEQSRTLKLISGDGSGAAAAATNSNGSGSGRPALGQAGVAARGAIQLQSDCAQVKTIRRECKQGCKYLRGEWSPDCVNGQRVRIDTLLVETAAAAAASDSSSKQQQQQQQLQQTNRTKCEPQRKVTKDCRRACHYVKSAWSECVNGFKTRDLRWEELPSSAADVPPPSSCVKLRQIKRECSSQAKQQQPQSDGGANRVKQTAAMTTTTPPPPPPSAATTGSSGSSSNGQKLTAAQRRRLKQLQRQQKQSTASSGSSSSSSSN